MITQIQQYIINQLFSSGLEMKTAESVSHLVLLGMALLTAGLTGYLCRKLVAPVIDKLVKNTKFVWDDYFFNQPVIKSLCHIVPGLVFYLLLPLCLPEDRDILYFIVVQGTKIYIAITFVSLVIAFLNNIENFTISEEKLKEKQLYGIIEFLKIIAYFIGGIIIISYLLGQSPLSMIAGIGAAATVLMLVFKDSILGLVAGIQLSTNKMLKPGDWITIKKLDIDGVVEQVSLTTVKVRNFDNTIATVPPYFLISDTFKNWTPMKNSSGRRVKRAFYIDINSIHYCNKELKEKLSKNKVFKEEDLHKIENKVNLTLFRKFIEQKLNSLDYINKDAIILIRQLEPTPNGLPLELYYFSKVTDFKEYEMLTAECIEQIIASINLFDLKLFQNPTGNDIHCLR